MTSLDPAAVAAHAFPERTASWGPDDVILYHLAVGAGAGAAPFDLRYVYERDLVVLPSFGTLFAIAPILELLRDPAVGVPLERLLHGEHRIDVHRPLPVAATITTSVRVEAIEDKDPHAVVALVVESREVADDRPLFTNRYRGFLRGAGGFGGTRRPRDRAAETGGRPESTVRLPTTPSQALLYRLCGDKHPLHVDPAFARAAGFDRPVLHGLCTFGLVCHGVVSSLLDGDATRLRTMSARFAEVVFPGETLELSCRRGTDAIRGVARCAERGTDVLTDLAIDLRMEGQDAERTA